MKLWNKIHIHPLTYILFFIAFISGLFKIAILIFSIVIIHELGHVIVASIFKRKITSINILPFGGLIKIDAFISSNIYEDLLISIGGILSQVLLGMIIYLLNNYNIIDKGFYDNFLFYNKLIIAFNLVPVCPLDGYKIIQLLIELFIPFKKTFTINFIISVALLVLTFIYKFNLLKENLIIYIFIIYMSILEFKNKKYILNRFYLERINHKFNFKRTINIKKIDDMYKNRINYINGIEEREALIYTYLCKLK